MERIFSPIWDTLASVRFAVLVLTSLAVVSIIGTVIPQNEPVIFYIDKYGQQLAILIKIFDFDCLYSSVWFRMLFSLMLVSILVCSAERLPRLWRELRKNMAVVDIARALDSRNATVLVVEGAASPLVETAILKRFTGSGWSVVTHYDQNGVFIEANKGRWTRFGPYIVHCSVVVLVAGAMIGNLFGFRAFVDIPEGEQSDTVIDRSNRQQEITLPFALRCDAFAIDYYDNGMPKAYRSDLAVLEKDQVQLTKQISVNHPLQYSGISFFQSSYRPLAGQYAVAVREREGDRTADRGGSAGVRTFVAKDERRLIGTAGIPLTIVATSEDGHGHGPYTVALGDKNDSSLQLAVEENQQKTVQWDGKNYTITVRQRFATGLQVVKDPGVWIVYVGCAMMLFGLFAAFFLRHYRVLMALSTSGAQTTVLLRVLCHKQTGQAARWVDGFVGDLLKDHTIRLRRLP